MFKKLIVPAVLLGINLFFAVHSLSAQTVYFCKDVDNNGNAVNPKTSFKMTGGSVAVKVLVKLDATNNCDSVYYNVYRGKLFDAVFSQHKAKDWTYFWKEIEFNKKGTYKIAVYTHVNDCTEVIYAEGVVKIK